MQTYTLKEMAKEHGVATARIVRWWREGKAIDGEEIHSEETDDGRVWWVGGGEAEQPETQDEGEVETKDQSKTETKDQSEITRKLLKSAKGIGNKAADGILAGCEELGITTIEGLAAIDDLTQFDGVGEGNGKALREKLSEAIIEKGDAPDREEQKEGDSQDIPQEQSAYPAFVYGLEAGDIAIAKREVDVAKEGNEPLLVDLSEPAKEAFGEWYVEKIGHEIRCPYCGDMFSRAPAGAYESSWAKCEADLDIPVGQCGQRFWVEATLEGYKTYQDKPDPGEPTKPDAEESIIDDWPDDDWGDDDDWDDGDWGDDEDWDDWDDEVTAEPDTASYLAVGERPHPMLPECRLLARTEAHTDEWHKTRSKGVGSSDAGAILGLSPYSTPADVYATKTGGETEHMPWLENYSAFGTWFEPFLREHLEEEFGIELIDGAEIGTLQSIHCDIALANIDGLDVTTGVIEEYKTTTEKWDTIPLHYEAQVHHQLYVTGASEARLRQFVCPMDRALVPSLLEAMRKASALPSDADRTLADWLLEHGEVHTWIIERDETYTERLIECERTFWEYVEMEMVPPPKDPEGTIDLSEEASVVTACEEYARIERVYESTIEKFLEAEGIDKDGRGSLSGKADKALKAAKKAARKAIDRAVALQGEGAKRVSIGGHKATLVERENYSYWNLCTGEVSNVTS